MRINGGAEVADKKDFSRVLSVMLIKLAIGMLKYANRYPPFPALQLSILVSLNLMSITAILCLCGGDGVAFPKSSSYRSFKIGLPESLQVATMTPQANLYLKP